MNIYDISQKAGVSTATVSRVLNNSPHVSEATRMRVLSEIEKSGYIPNPFARGLGLNTMKTIGILCPDASDPYLSTALSFLEKAFRIHHYNTILICTGREREDRAAGIDTLLSQRVDGMVLMGSSFVEENDSHNEPIRSAAAVMPIVILGSFYNWNNIFGVMCDDKEAMTNTVRYLIGKGRKNIAYVYDSDNESGKRKLQGYIEGITANGLKLNKDLICRVQREGGINSVRESLTLINQAGLAVDAVMACNDILAIGALKYAHDLKIAVPDRLSVVGYNNSAVSLYCEPELTTVDNHLPDICEQVASTMMGALEHKSLPKQIVFSAELKLRGTA